MEMLESQVKRKMREWTEKHIIELIKQHSGGGGIITSPIYQILLNCSRYYGYYVDVKRSFDIKSITDVASRILHLDTSMWQSSHKLKSTIDEKWDEGYVLKTLVSPGPFYSSISSEYIQCFLIPTEYKSTNMYNTYTQWGFKVKQMFISLPDYIPFFNMESFSMGGTGHRDYGIDTISIIGAVNGVVNDIGIDGDLLTDANSDVRAGWTVTDGSLTEAGNYYTTTAEANGADVYVVKSVFQKWFEKFHTYEIYIEVLNNDVIIRPDEIPQEGRVFYGNDIKTAFEYPDGYIN